MANALMDIMTYITEHSLTRLRGEEDFFCILDVGIVPQSEKDKRYIIDCVEGNLTRLIEEVEEGASLVNDEYGYTQEVLYKKINEDIMRETRALLKDDLATLTKNEEVRSFSIGLSLRDIAKQISENAPLNQLYLFWYRWYETSPEDGDIEVYYLHDVLLKALKGSNI